MVFFVEGKSVNLFIVQIYCSKMQRMRKVEIIYKSYNVDAHTQTHKRM